MLAHVQRSKCTKISGEQSGGVRGTVERSSRLVAYDFTSAMASRSSDDWDVYGSYAAFRPGP
jgi:hypothetical protein